jgi:mitochondrial fission protein ELM1
MTSEYFEKYIEIEGKENIEEALKKGNGLIFLAVHFGSWELSNIICARLGLTYRVVAREQKRFSKLNELLNSYRQSKGTMVITRGITTREVVKSLQKNEVVGMVVDQGGKDGSLIDFFGKDASMPTGAIRLALKLDTPVLVVFIVRKNGPYHKVIIKPQFKLTRTEDLEQDISTNLIQVVKIAEEMIRNYPEQYMWFYKIWKYSLTRSIVVLNDGKAGHLRQSQAVAQILSSRLNNRGISSKVKIIDSNFKNKFARQFIALSCFLARRRHCKGCLWCLKNFLEEGSFKEVINSSADFVISCGQALAAVNFIFSAEKSAKSITILNPGILGFRRFDLVVIPQHDHPPSRKNIVITKGAPNLINQEYLISEKESLLKSFPDLAGSQKESIGLFLGGDTKKYLLTKEIMEKVLAAIRSVCEEFDLELLTTTSRRTPLEIDGFLKKEMAGFKSSKLLIIANENNHPNAVGGILSLSKIVIVSGESISMISEAACSEKTLIVFHCQPRFDFNRNKDKHEIFLHNLAKEGFIYLTDANNIQGVLRDCLVNKRQTKRMEDDSSIQEAIEKII